MSKLELAKLLGITHRQVQKYELGINRISVSRLVQIAAALEAPVAWFFREVDQERDGSERADALMQLLTGFPEQEARDRLTVLWEWLAHASSRSKRPAPKKVQQRAGRRRG